MKRIIIGLLVLLVIAGCTSSAETEQTNDVTTNAVATVGDDGYQEITLSYGRKGPSFNYIFTPDTVQAGIPVRLTAEVDKLQGCYRYIQIPSLGIGHYMKEGDNVVEFTPEEAGDIKFTCSMGMGNAKLHVI